jgi:hypothetical protein
MSEIPKSVVLPEEKGKVFAFERYQHVAAAIDNGELKPILRRFGTLNTLHLLILQRELAKLEEDFFALSLSQDGAKMEDIASFYLGMKQRGYINHQNTDEQTKQKWDLLLKLQEALKIYSKLQSIIL